MPIEHDPKMTKEQKLPYMIEWWTKSMELTVQTQIHHDDIIEIVQNSTTHLKEGCQWFFYTLERYEVPLLVFSAGLGNIIQEWLLHQLGSFKNMRIVSNFMAFDKDTNRITGFIGSLIHIFNKNEGVLLETEYEKLIANRPNVILLGDSLGDVDMANGFPSLNNIIKIGFLNDETNSKELLAKHMNAYDIVIINDNTFNVPNAILRSII
jgi:HAD superfamily hydrolase (TIGR01544 family)